MYIKGTRNFRGFLVKGKDLEGSNCGKWRVTKLKNIGILLSLPDLVDGKGGFYNR